MASTRVTSNIYTDGENALVARGKASLATRTSNRNALGTIANQAHLLDGRAKTNAKQIVKKPSITTEKKSLMKNHATSHLLQLPKQRHAPKEEVKEQTVDSYVIEAPERPAHVKEIDLEDSDNPQLVSEYINEIYVYLRRIERQQTVRKHYMEGYQITPRMRLILMDWLIQVHQRFHLLQETLYLTVAIIDRFLQDGEVSKGKLQLVGVTAMWIASKYEEMYAPEINDFVYITDNAYTKANIRQMERIMLKRLDFDLGRPLPLHFLRRYSKAGEVDGMKHALAKYLLELSLMDYHMTHIHPSEMAAASLCLSIRLLDDEPGWNDTLAFYSTYTEEHLQPIMNQLALNIHKSYSSKQQSVRQKYQSSKFMKISMIEELQSSLVEDWAETAKSEQS